MHRFMQRVTIDFNIYLAPFDDYSIDIESIVSTISGHQGEPSAQLIVTDNSCAPFLNTGQELLPFNFDYFDGQYDTDMDRAQVGNIEVIDMGTVINPEAQHILHTNGVPNNCTQIQGNWRGGGLWDIYSGGDPEISMSNITGGISTSLRVINEKSMEEFTVSSIPFNNTYINEIYHEEPGSRNPMMYKGLTNSVIESEGESVTINWNFVEFNNITALLQKTSISAEFDFTQALNSDINWVVSLLNKKAHVAQVSQTIPPFLSLLNINDQGACDELQVEVRDEFGELLNPLLNQNFNLCEAVNVVPIKPFGKQPALILDDSYRSFINVGHLDKGSITLKTNAENVIEGFDVQNPSEHYYSFGLPLAGFQLTRTDDGINQVEYQKQEFITTKGFFADLIFANGFE